jgi:adenosylcobinamide kinase/adenosylcobinamide-phosphate guanylyltransferase
MGKNDMQTNRIILVGGGARSGKSRFALNLAMKLGARRLFVATGQARDDEMAQRIRAHQQSRGADFHTVEEPLSVTEVLRHIENVDVVLIDCLTLWLANLLLDGNTPEQIDRRVHELVEVCLRRTFHAVVVTNEVGMGIVPETPLGRVFRDVAGLAHQTWSRHADEVYLGMLGTLLRLKPAPEFIPWEEGDA